MDVPLPILSAFFSLTLVKCFFLPKDAEAEADKSKLEEEEAKKIVESLTDSITSGEKKDIEESTKDIVKKAALAVNSLKETEFDIRFNPDVFRLVFYMFLYYIYS